MILLGYNTLVRCTESPGHCELQLCGDLFLSLGCSDCREDKIDVLLGTGFVCNNAIVIEVSNDRKI